MTILVTGASGLLGSHVVQQLVKTNHHIVVSIMPTEKTTYKPLPSVEVVLNDDIYAGRVRNIDVVIHCAFSRSNDPQDLANGLDFTAKILQGFEKCGVKAVINISSQGVYKRLPNNELSSEDSPIEPIDLYSMTKYAIEKLFLCSQVPQVTNVRLASLNMKQRFLYKFVEAAKKGQPILVKSPQVYASILDVNDAAKALVALALTSTQQWADTYNVGLGAHYSLLQYAYLVKEVADTLGYHTDVIVEDNGTVSSAGMSIERLHQLTGWQPIVSTQAMIEQLFTI